MNDHPHQISQQEPTMKQLWLASFTALLTRLSPEDAIKEADRALKLCNAHWKEQQWVWARQLKHNYPIGSQFFDDPSLPPADSD